MPSDISDDIYRYLARDWRHSSDTLSAAKIRQLKRDIPDLRKRYESDRRIPYNDPSIRRAYLASFAARYSCILYDCLNLAKARALQTLKSWDCNSATMCLIGGGPGCELIGLLDWLYENDVRPKHLHVIILDREGYWRSFHSFLFVEILGRFFRKTQILPSYESIDFPISKQKRFKRESVNYQFAHSSLLAEARLVSIINFLSEIPDHRGFECQFRYLTRLAWEKQLVVCADSAANKRRKRLDWIDKHFNRASTVKADELYSGVHDFDCPWLNTMTATSSKIFQKAAAPMWLHSFKRWIYMAETLP